MTRSLSSWDGVSDLVETLDRQIEFLGNQPNDRLLIGLPQLLAFLEYDSRQVAVIADLVLESQRALNEFEAEGKRLRSSLADVWGQARPLLHTARDLPNTGEFDDHDDFDGLERALSLADEIDTKAFLYRGEPDDDPRAVNGLLSKMQQWVWSAKRAHRRTGKEVPDLLGDIEDQLMHLKEMVQFSYRRYWLDGRTLPGNAYERLKYTASWINPAPRPSGVAEGWEHAGHEYLNKDLVEALYLLSRPPSEDAQRTLEETAQQVRRDLALVHLQLRARIVMTHSRLGLVKRFAARCERFDAKRLKDAATSESKKAEDKLRGELARFLFDHGLNPLLDPTISGLRPDVLDVRLGKPVYVEAKRYGKGKEREQFIKGFRQMLDTRGRLSNAFRDLREAFLVVFRLGGRRVEFPEVVHIPGGVIYTVLADLDPATGGSRQKYPPVLVTESDLLDTGTRDSEITKRNAPA